MPYWKTSFLAITDSDFKVAVFFEIKHIKTVQNRAVVRLLINVNRNSCTIY